MQLWVEPDTMRSMFTAMPEMMKLMPDVMPKMKAIDAKYPKPEEPAKAAKALRRRSTRAGANPIGPSAGPRPSRC